MNYKKYLFIDRDGTLIQEPADQQIDAYEKFKLLDDVIPSLLSLQSGGYKLVMVSNQDGLGTPKYSQQKFDMIQNLLMSILQTQGIQFESVLICPHFENEKCFCRKPNLGLVNNFLCTPELDKKKSFVIGDRQSDLVLAENMGIGGIKIHPENGWHSIARQLLSQPRVGQVIRETKETKISANVDLDDSKTLQISTGIGFFDHMLQQLSHHGGFGCAIRVKGDLHIDDHHTIEDTGIALGTALRQALGDKTGTNRFGFYLPMDDASTRVTMDLSGRSYFQFEGKFSRETIGELSCEMIPHFFKSFAESLGANLHIHVEGVNTHHQVESIFKAVGRSLRTAIQVSSNEIPSTKGVL